MGKIKQGNKGQRKVTQRANRNKADSDSGIITLMLTRTGLILICGGGGDGVGLHILQSGSQDVHLNQCWGGYPTCHFLEPTPKVEEWSLGTPLFKQVLGTLGKTAATCMEGGAQLEHSSSCWGVKSSCSKLTNQRTPNNCHLASDLLQPAPWRP